MGPGHRRRCRRRRHRIRRIRVLVFSSHLRMRTGARLVVVGLRIRVVCVLGHGGCEGHGGIWRRLDDVDQPWLDDLDVAASQVCANAELHVSAVRACTSTDFMSVQKYKSSRKERKRAGKR
jgi:hypothetical protein